jgi:hypothetical protein
LAFTRYRAACVTIWLIVGIRLNDLVAWMGHADLRTTIETFCHRSSRQKNCGVVCFQTIRPRMGPKSAFSAS